MSGMSALGSAVAVADSTAVDILGACPRLTKAAVRWRSTVFRFRSGAANSFRCSGRAAAARPRLLRIIGGFEQLTSGQVLIDGADAGFTPPYARSTNMIFQHLALFPHMNVFENIAFGLRRKKVPERRAARSGSTSALALVQLEGYGGRMTDQLSGGQKQRVAMARAMVNEPSVLLLDEPLAALDLQLRLQMQDELRRLHRSSGRTFIYVTHDQGEAMSMSDRIGVMRGRQAGADRHAGGHLQPAPDALCRGVHRPHQSAGRCRRRSSTKTGMFRSSARETVLPGGFASACRIRGTARDGRVEV